MKKRFLFQSWLVLLLVCASNGLIIAQSDNLSRMDAVAFALENNLGIQMAKHQVEISQIDNSWGAAGALPQLVVSASGSNSLSDQTQNPTSFFREKFKSQSVRVAGEFNWMLFDGLGMFANKQSLDHLAELAEGQAALIVEQTVAGTIQAYNSVLVQKALLDVLSMAMEVSTERLDWVKSRSEMGSASVFDCLQFENALLADSLSWLQQKANVGESENALNRLMGIDAGRVWEFVSNLDEPADGRDFNRMQANVLANATAIQNALIARQIARTGVRQAESRISPTLLLSASQNDQGSRFSAGEETQDGRTKNFAANLTLRFNLFNGGATRRAIQRANIELEMAENRAQDEAREVSQILHDSWMRWNSARSSFLISIQIVKNGTQTLEIATQKLASGAINSIDFRDIQLQLINAKQQQVQSLYLWQFEDVELRRLSGEWIFKSMDE